MSLQPILYSPNVTIDFNTSEMEVLDLKGNVTFSAAHLNVRKQKTIKIYAAGQDCNMSFPASMVFVGGAAPATITNGKTAILSLYCFGSADSDIVAAYTVQP